jgi:hydrogenase maturation protein HypF
MPASYKPNKVKKPSAKDMPIMSVTSQIQSTQSNHQTTRQRLRVTGVVQGVGFRPHVYALALALGLSGFVGNDDAGVFIEIEGADSVVTHFAERLKAHPPPLAHIDNITSEIMPVQNVQGFAIIASQKNGGTATLISPDVGLCDDCLRELNDPNDRRYRYPFINCTNCGPRFTIIEGLPYDRPLTTMASFKMCPTCQSEYDDPTNRRFHAQPNACPDCGPYLMWRTSGEYDSDDTEEYATHEMALTKARQAIREGKIIAVKGLGGYHLACDATNEEAVARLRKRKQRPAKPFAIMVADVSWARDLACVNVTESRMLSSQQRPIVLIRKCPEPSIQLASSVAPDVNMLGIFLPYTPLHYLLLEEMPPLVMTSANISGEPIITTNKEVMTKLGHVADGFLHHNRAIHSHCDDSVLRVVERDSILPLRRSRGYAPFPIRLHESLNMPPLLAVGAELKNTFCLARGRDAFMSQHIGDMGSMATMQSFERTVTLLCDLFRVQPERIVTDAHPAYTSTQIGQRLAQTMNLPVVQVQHHHAHIVSCMVQNQLPHDERVLGICWDGTGYGDDGAIWGGEVMVAGYDRYERIAHLQYAPLPGGDSAIKHPYRAALARLYAHDIAWDEDIASVAYSSAQERRILQQQLERSLNTVPTSSMGRLFDSVASLLGIGHESLYEAHAAMKLEGIAQDSAVVYDFSIDTRQRPYQIDPTLVLQGVIHDMRTHVPVPIIAGRFQAATVALIEQLAHLLKRETGIKRIALSGGVFQNHYVLYQARRRLTTAGFEVLTHHIAPPNDGGIALGQAVAGGLIPRPVMGGAQ